MPEARFLQLACRVKYEHANPRVAGVVTAGNSLSDEQIQEFIRADSVPDLANIIWANDLAARATPPPQIEDGSKVYALVYCTKDGYCQIHGHAHMVGNGVFEEVPYRTLSECRQQYVYSTNGIKAGRDGRTVLPDGSWWECRSKYLDTWEPAQ